MPPQLKKKRKKEKKFVVVAIWYNRYAEMNKWMKNMVEQQQQKKTFSHYSIN